MAGNSFAKSSGPGLDSFVQMKYKTCILYLCGLFLSNITICLMICKVRQICQKKAKYKINNGKKVLFTWANVLLTCMWSAEFINQWNQHVNIYTRRVLSKRHKCRKDIHTVIPAWKISIFKVQAETFSQFLTRTLTIIDRMSWGALNITHVSVKSFIWSLRVNREPTVQINTGFDGGPVLPWALELVDPHLIIMFIWICFIFCQ